MFARILVLIVPLLLLAACSSSDDDDSESAEDQSVLEEVIEDIEDFLEVEAEIPEDHEAITESDEEAPGAEDVDIEEGTGDLTEYEQEEIPPEVYTAYDGLVEFVIEDLDFYWSEIFPEVFGVEFVLPDIYGPYYEEGEVDCGGEPAVLNNAFYCPIGDFIAWDESTLLLPYYLNIGDFGAALVLAHEYGHAVQQQLGVVADFTIQLELQADCFAGSWALSADEAGILEEGDVEEGFETLYTIADPEGVDWTDPRAHGTAEERVDAFALGFNNGVEACFEFTE